MNTVLIKDALNNLLPRSGATDDYCRGLVLGVVAALMATKFDGDFDRAFYLVKWLLPTGYRVEGIPEPWRKSL
jgi:hypothetical protein